jgi:hypothetical protein
MVHYGQNGGHISTSSFSCQYSTGDSFNSPALQFYCDVPHINVTTREHRNILWSHVLSQPTLNHFSYYLTFRSIAICNGDKDRTVV